MYISLASSFTDFLNSLFTWEMLFALVVGICGGLIIGALPGLNPSAGICMLIPITYRMQPTAALTMLMAIYTAGILGGSYTAILLHTPGTTASVATIADGHAMVNNGKPLKALMASTYASCIGGVVSALALLFMAPVLAKLSLKFDAPEYFLLGILGICLIASLAEDSLIKGLISGCLGLLLSTIGTYPLEALYRFTFGIKELRSGLDSTIVLLGLFAISQAIATFSKNRENMGKHETIDKVDFKGEKLSWKERIRNLPLVIYTSILGAFIGILPGAGASIGSFVGYNEAKRLSKNKEQ